jgi:hypothetical protein
MIDFLRTLKLPLVIFAIVASLWAYARAQTLGQQATQSYWPALSQPQFRVAAAGPVVSPKVEDFDVELVEVESDSDKTTTPDAAKVTPAPAPAVIPADSSQIR